MSLTLFSSSLNVCVALQEGVSCASLSASVPSPYYSTYPWVEWTTSVTADQQYYAASYQPWKNVFPNLNPDFHSLASSHTKDSIAF